MMKQRSHGPSVRAVFWQAIWAVFLCFGFHAAAAEEKIIKSHGISAFGELKYGPDFTHFDYANPDAPKGGTFSAQGTGASKTFDSLNPFILKGEPAQGLVVLYDSLLTISADEPDSAYGLIAQSLEYPENRQWVIFNMRPEAKFADGTPITASDVVFSYETLIKKGHPAYKIIYKDIQAVSALDDHRVKFTFVDGVSTRDLPSVAGGIAVLPKHYYDNVDFAQSTLTPPLGSGEYEVSEVKPGRSIKYCRIKDYWAKDLAVNIGTNNFDCFLYEYFTDTTAAFEAFKAGEFNFHEEFFSKIWATGYNFPALEKGWVVRESIPDGSPSGTQGFWFNMRKDKFKNIKTREAIAQLFNFEWSNETLFYGLYTRTDSFWENSPMQAEGPLQGGELTLLEPFRDQLPTRVFEEDAYLPPVSITSKSDRRALRRASKLLDEAGWALEDGKRTNAQGEVLTIEILNDSSSSDRIINPFVENLKRAGIEAVYSLIDPAQYQQRQEDFDYDIVPGRLAMSLSPSEELASTFGSQGAATKGTTNLTGISDPVVDGLITKISEAKNRGELVVRVKALDRVLRSLQIWVPNWFKASHSIAYWDIFGRPETKPKYARGVMNLWWFDQSKYDRLKAEGAF